MTAWGDVIGERDGIAPLGEAKAIVEAPRRDCSESRRRSVLDELAPTEFARRPVLSKMPVFSGLTAAEGACLHRCATSAASTNRRAME
ncbi:hypothetical protein [Burkholderia sp. S-53]|uniref:hypothetical protein n=1 Tax=Burkholderia sp. S-53 TaxID=2906514 RepID=UPI0021D38B59|nr:hypothetical protein [Burkholderia sp. S-53]UXU85672.1 hypothetical protein LXM88_04725 [Burkholderia sp. S-53]